MRLAIGAAIVLAVAGTASAATTRKVPADYASIQAAEDASVDGDTIQVARGRYILDATINVDVPNLIIKGSGAIIDGARPNLNDNTVDGFNVTGAGVTITGFTFRNGENGVYVNAANCAILKCTFIDLDDIAVYANSGDGLRVEGCKFLGTYGTIEAYADNLRVLKNTVRGSDTYSIYVSGNGARLEGNTVTYSEDSDAIYISGNNAVVLKNKVYNSDSYGIDISGNDAVVGSNTIKKIDQTGIYVDGTNAVIEKNKFNLTDGVIECYGNGADILGNKAVDFNADDGIEVEADDMLVVGNSVTLGSNDADGFYLYSKTAAGSGTVENNKVVDVMDAGFYFGNNFFVGVTVRNCSVMNCGSEDESGFDIDGTNNFFEGLKVTNVDNKGFYVDGNGNEFVKCSVVNAYSDGFHVNSGDNNMFTDCTAAKCGGEGFDNRGGSSAPNATKLIGGKYRGDRNDVANDTTGGAFITLTNVDKSTPGTPQSQVD
jgi:hypothetical protein